MPLIQSALEIIEPEAEVVDSIHSGNAHTVNPPRSATLSARDLRPERERISWIRLRPIDDVSSALPQAPVA